MLKYIYSKCDFWGVRIQVFTRKPALLLLSYLTFIKIPSWYYKCIRETCNEGNVLDYLVIRLLVVWLFLFLHPICHPGLREKGRKNTTLRWRRTWTEAYRKEEWCRNRMWAQLRDCWSSSTPIPMWVSSWGMKPVESSRSLPRKLYPPGHWLPTWTVH